MDNTTTERIGAAGKRKEFDSEVLEDVPKSKSPKRATSELQNKRSRQILKAADKEKKLTKSAAKRFKPGSEQRGVLNKGRKDSEVKSAVNSENTTAMKLLSASTKAEVAKNMANTARSVAFDGMSKSIGKKSGSLVKRPTKKIAAKTQIANIRKNDDGTSIDISKKTSAGRKEVTRKSSVPNKFSLIPEEQPASAKKTKGSGRKSKDARREEEVRDGEETFPDVVIHKGMTKGKLALLNLSPFSGIIAQEDKDAAAEELYGKGTKFEENGDKRMLDSSEAPDIIPLDVNAEPSARAAAASDPVQDPAELKARRKEKRKLKRKVRQVRSTGALSNNEKAAPAAGVIYLGHIPHGFYEKEMRGYFSQFGEVTRLRLSRSKKTARSRGFAFIEFADQEVATIAAESMDGYLMHGQALVAKVVPPEKVHPEAFKGADKTFKKIPFSAIKRRDMIQRSRDPLKLATRSKGVQKNARGKRKNLAKLHIQYKFPGFVATEDTEDQ